MLDPGEQRLYLFIGPVPPGQRLQSHDVVIAETHSQDFGGRPCDHGVGGDILIDQRARCNDGTITNTDSGHNHRVHADPDIIAYAGIASRSITALECLHLQKRISTDEVGIVGMVAPHQDLHTCGDLHVVADVKSVDVP